MTDKISKEDQDWIDALSGQTASSLDPIVSAQATAVRNALIARRNAIEADPRSVDISGIDQIRLRLQREGLMEVSQNSLKEIPWWQRALDTFGIGSSGGGAKAVPIWGVAAMLVIAVVVTIQVRGPREDEAAIYRGDPNVVTLIVEKPEQRMNELSSGLKPIDPTLEVNKLPYGRFELKIKDSQAVRDYLLAQRIEPIIVNGYITIAVTPLKK